MLRSIADKCCLSKSMELIIPELPPSPARMAAFMQSVVSFRVPQLPGVSCMRANFVVEAYDDVLFNDLGIECPPGIRQSVRKRKAEYLAGRYLVAQLLTARGWPAAVGTGAHREPLWPGGAVGSITHADSVAVAAVADDPAISLLGIDFESWIDEALTTSLALAVVDQGERARAESGQLSAARAFTLAFSAKESLFKALYPEVRAYFDFDKAELVSIDWSERTFLLRIRTTLSKTVAAGCVFRGAFLPWAGGMFTVVAG